MNLIENRPLDVVHSEASTFIDAVHIRLRLSVWEKLSSVHLNASSVARQSEADCGERVAVRAQNISAS